MNWLLITLCFLPAFALTSLGMFPLLRVLKRRAILDYPNERSSHDVPTPKGAGLLLIPVSTLFLVLFDFFEGGAGVPAETLGIAVLAAILCGFSWLDDLRGLPVIHRLIAHGMATIAGLWLFSGNILIFKGLIPPVLDHILAVFLWMWFINLFNFMDGIDGISGVQTISICLGIIIVYAVSDSSAEDIYFATILGAAAFGFLLWNWPSAKIFLGDAGSAPLGFLLGWLLIRLAAAGEWEAAIILPLYYLADTAVTLLRRLFHGEKVWQAHRQHFYQQAIQNGRTHRSVAMSVAGVNLCLVSAAIFAAMGFSAISVLCAVFLVVSFLWYLAKH